ncbi:hypothetical protein MUCCIDRAFT_167461 [Mucor lusitanicus CBS 277.49]|uniref:GRAM domain-containing protein n=1 Tax=Mucor lusitanicus CBS 277.49 TaxID=747725 RepID=A0A168H4Y1_MUCCL|nr:hypothetical protein MUCCIDRAFT_167461 [Mucor lusitanicus CBS 277.49]
MNANLSVETSSLLSSPPPKPPRNSARHHSVSSGTDSANEQMPPPISPKRLSVNPTPQPRSSMEPAFSMKNTASPPFTSKEMSPIIHKADKPPTSPVSAVHENSKRRDSISSLLNNSSLETCLNEIKQLGRQVKRQLLEDEDIMSLGNRMLPASPQPPPAVRRNRAISVGPSTSIDDLVRQQQEQLFDSFNKLKQYKQAETSSHQSDARDLAASGPVDQEKKHEETAPDEPVLSTDIAKLDVGNEQQQPIIPVVYADEKRNQYFHTLFRSVPEENRLIEEYNCAMYKDILVQGKLYISQEYLCFNAKFFGWVTNLVLAYKDIKSIEKRNMALIVPNGIQITTHLDTKHVFASFVTRDYTFDLIYQTWQASLFPKRDANEINDPQAAKEKDNHADLANQHVAQIQTIPEETAVSSKHLLQSDIANKHYQWIVMDEVYIGTVEGFYKLLYQSDFVYHYLVETAQCQDVQFGAWDQESKTRSSIITKDGVEYQDIPLFKSFQKVLSRKSTRITLQQLSEGKQLSTCWHRSNILAFLRQKYVMPSVQIMKQAYLVFALSVQSAYQYVQAMKREHWLTLLLLMANLLTLHHMNARVYQLEHQHCSPLSLTLPANILLNETTTDPAKLHHIEFMQLKMDEIKQKMALLHRDVALQRQQLLNESHE